MKPMVYFQIKRFWFSGGWFSGEPLILFQLNLLETDTDSRGKIDHLTIFGVQILKFVISFGFNWYKYQK